MTDVLVTGAAGFIGSHLVARLVDAGRSVVGLDSLDPYYDPQLKLDRLARLEGPSFEFVHCDIGELESVDQAFARHRPRTVVNLAAQAGVRHGLKNPYSYARTNLLGFVHVAEAARRAEVEHFVYASSSSVYGETSEAPFSPTRPADHPVSLYAATKKSNELLAHSYAHTYGMPCTGLRFFTVYGPWGRPDMAYYAFAERIAAGRPITIYGTGDVRRDFTYIDDIVEGLSRILDLPAQADPTWTASAPDPSRSPAPHRVFNIGRGQQVALGTLIDLLGDAFGVDVERVHEPAAPGDVPLTHADVEDFFGVTGFRPQVSIEEGISRFVDWFRAYRTPR